MAGLSRASVSLTTVQRQTLLTSGTSTIWSARMQRARQYCNLTAFIGGETCVEPRAQRVGAIQAHCWVLRDRVIDSSGPPPPRTTWRLRRKTQSPCQRGSGGRSRPQFENYTVDASIFVARQATKGTWWMPWHQEPMKDVGACDKPREVGNQAVIRGFPNGETQLESCPVTSA